MRFLIWARWPVQQELQLLTPRDAAQILQSQTHEASAVLPNRDEGTIRGTPYGVRNVAVSKGSSALVSPFSP